jgi:hypothetical protein
MTVFPASAGEMQAGYQTTGIAAPVKAAQAAIGCHRTRAAKAVPAASAFAEKDALRIPIAITSGKCGDGE